MQINEIYNTDHDLIFAENIKQKCLIINELHKALVEKDGEIQRLTEKLKVLNGTTETSGTNKS